MYFFTVMGIGAGLLAFVEIAFYIAAIFGRDYRWHQIQKTVPNRASWIIWACVGIITAASYDAAGARETIWFAVVYALGFIIVALLSSDTEKVASARQMFSVFWVLQCLLGRGGNLDRRKLRCSQQSRWMRSAPSQPSKSHGMNPGQKTDWRGHRATSQVWQIC
jgi:hypothetical protein